VTSPYREPPERKSDPDMPTHPNETLAEGWGCAVFFWCERTEALRVRLYGRGGWPQ